jgi:hypothetical protein
MHDLLFTLQGHDIGHLRIIAEFWGLDLPAETTIVAAEWLAAAMLETEILFEIIDSLPPQARQPWNDLLDQDGRSAYADMVRRYGAIREMGVGRRDRQKPWREPVSGLEILWYRGLVARSFMETSGGAQEFLYIPADLHSIIPLPHPATNKIPGRETVSPLHIKPATTTLIDDVTTLLASLRREPAKSGHLDYSQKTALDPFLHHPLSQELIFTLLGELGMLSPPPVQPLSEPTRKYITGPKHKSLAELLQAWRDSSTWNDLQHIDGISVPADEWPNDPLLSRHAILEFLRMVPIGKWWDMDSFIQFFRYHKPSFLRPAGDFDSWYLQNKESGEFMRGFEFWDSVEGALIRFILTQPLHFLGAVDLGGVNPQKPTLSFRLTILSKFLFDAEIDIETQEDSEPVKVFPDGRILATPFSSQAHRYQVARFCDWVDLNEKGFGYRLTPSALQRAMDQNLTLQQVKSILEAANNESLHPSLERAITRWAEKGRELFIEKTIVLRVKNQQVMEFLQTNPSTSRYFHEILGATTASVKEKDLEKLFSAASRLGILVDIS